MPDALSKTIPIWSAVLNRALFPTETAYHPVHLPPNYLGASEEAQIESRIDSFVASLKVCTTETASAKSKPAYHPLPSPSSPGRSIGGGIGHQTTHAQTNLKQNLKLDLDHLREQLGKPIRIAWANRTYFHPTDLYKGEGYNLLVLCSASRRVQGAEMSEGGYIQGAGDDAEGWAHGLTPPVFWEHRALLKDTREEDLPALIGDLVSLAPGGLGQGSAARIAPTRNLFIGVAGQAGGYDLVIDCNANGPGEGEGVGEVEGGAKPVCKRLNLGCASAKLGSRDLRKSLDRVREFVAREFKEDSSRSLLVTCENGRDLSAGALLAIICLFYNDQGMYLHCMQSRIRGDGLLDGFQSLDGNGKRESKDKNETKERLTSVL
jgi:tRNA A64-2'-O-ribosylphosphate transferase